MGGIPNEGKQKAKAWIVKWTNEKKTELVSLGPDLGSARAELKIITLLLLIIPSFNE